MSEHEVPNPLVITHQQTEVSGFDEQLPDGKYTLTSAKRIGLVIPVLNNFEGAVDLLQSVRSKNIVSTYLMPQYRTQHREHGCLSQAWNRGITRAFAEGCDYAIVCNDDIMFAPETIDAMVTELERLRPEGVVMVTASNVLGAMPDKYDILNHYPNIDEPQTADHPDFSCFIVDRNFFEEMGTFDEKFTPAWCEDMDMHQRIYLAGKRAVVSTKCPIVHLIGVTTSKLAGSLNSSASDTHFYEKWGSKNVTVPQAFSHPYNDETKDHRYW